MKELIQMKCSPCRVGAPLLSEKEILQFLSQTPGWKLVEENNIKRLRRVYTFEDFMQALAFTNRVGELAETEGHHPTLETAWGTTTVTWWTHKINGLHQNDFIMAAKSDDIYTVL